MNIVKRLRRVGLPRLIVHASVLVVVLLWLLPTLGILVSSLRDKDQITVSGWWTAFSSSEQTAAVRLADASVQKQDGSRYVISGNVFENGQGGKVAAFGVRVQEPTAFKVARLPISVMARHFSSIRMAPTNIARLQASRVRAANVSIFPSRHHRSSRSTIIARS